MASASGGRDAALRVLRDLRALLENVRLPSAVRAGVLEELDRVSADDAKQERRRRQMALLDTPDPHGLTALHVSDTIDAFDRQSA